MKGLFKALMPKSGVQAAVVLLVMYFLIFSFSFAAFGASEVTYGDINNDGEIDVRDVVLVIQYALELRTLTPDQLKAADVNGDGEVNVLDVTLIKQYSLRVIEEFPVQLEDSSVKGKITSAYAVDFFYEAVSTSWAFELTEVELKEGQTVTIDLSEAVKHELAYSLSEGDYAVDDFKVDAGHAQDDGAEKIVLTAETDIVAGTEVTVEVFGMRAAGDTAEELMVTFTRDDSGKSDSDTFNITGMHFEFLKADHDADFNKRNMDTYGDNTLVIAGRFFDAGIYTFDISDPLDPRILDYYDTTAYDGSTLGVRVSSDGYVFAGQGSDLKGFSRGGHLHIFDIRDPSNIVKVTTLTDDYALWGSHGLALGQDEDYLYVTSYRPDDQIEAGLAIIDVRDRASPEITGVVEGRQYHDVAVTGDGNYAFVTDYGIDDHVAGVITVDISDKENPEAVNKWMVTEIDGGFDFTAGARLSNNEQYFYFGAGEQEDNLEGGLAVLDVTDPLNPTLASFASAGIKHRGPYRLRLDEDENYAFTVHTTRIPGINVWDISDPQNIKHHKHIAEGGQALEVEIHPNGRYIYTSAAERLTIGRKPSIGIYGVGE